MNLSRTETNVRGLKYSCSVATPRSRCDYPDRSEDTLAEQKVFGPGLGSVATSFMDESGH